MTTSDGDDKNALACFLEITGGRHLGVRVEFGADGCSIGTDVGCDLILADSGIADHHLTLFLHGSELRVEIGGSHAFVGESELPPGCGTTTIIPAEFRLGGASFRVSLPQDPKTIGFLSSNFKWVIDDIRANSTAE